MNLDNHNVAVIAAVIAAAAAISSAVISALFGFSVSKRTATQKLAEMRQIWIEDLRNHLADFVGSIHQIMNESTSAGSRESKTKALEKMNADLMRLESYISMKLNHDEEPHRRLANVVAQTRGAAAYISHGAADQLVSRTNLHLREIDELSRFVFKVEWDRASDEIKPVGRRKRKEREQARSKKFKLIQDTSAQFTNPLIFNPKE